MEEARVKVTLNGEEARRELDQINNRIAHLIELKKKAESEGDVKGWKRVNAELSKTEREAKKLEKQFYDIEKTLKNINGASIEDLQKAERALVEQTKKLNRETDLYLQKRDQLKLVRKEMASINSHYREQPGIMTKAANAANKYFNMITLAIASITGIVFSFAQFVKGMVGLDDALADVQKTTGLTRKEVRELYSDFRLLNTRTPRAELLALAEEAGRLGKTGKKDIMSFVEVANKIKIALGDDLGGNAEEAIREVGKLTEIFKIGDQYGTDFKTSMEKVGSGINTVANNSNASAGYLIEYMKRLGGTAVQARISAADIMGYAATFDQLGQNVEMAATAQSKIIVDMFTDPAKYARIAKMEVKEFNSLLQTDANEAFVKFLDGLNGNNEGLSVMATKLDDLGIDGARAIQALAALSSNTKMLKEQQSSANDAMQKGISLNQEYEIKNNNLAGSWAKLTAFIHSKFINSGFLSSIENAIGKISEMTQVTHPLTKALQDEATQVNLLTIEMTNANTPAERRNEIYNELKRIAPDVVANIDAENISISTLKGNLEQYNQAMIKKLALQDSEETMADKRKAAGKAAASRAELEASLMKEMNWVLAMEKSTNRGLAPKMEEVLLSNVDLLSKYRKMVEIGGGTDFASKTVEKLTSARDAEKKATDAVAEALNDYLVKYELVMGKTVPENPNGPKKGDRKTVGNSVFEWTGSEWEVVQNLGSTLNGEEQKKASGKLITSMQDANNARMTVLQTQYQDEKWSDEKFKAEQLDSELIFLIQKKAILLKFGQDIADIDAQINQNRLQSLENHNKVALENDKSFKKERENSDKEFVESFEDNAKTEEAILKNQMDATTDMLKDSIDKIKDAKDRESDVLEQRAQAYQAISQTIVSSLSDMLSGSLDEYATYGDALILMSLQILKQMTPIWAAQIVGGSLATPDSIMTGGIAGVAKFTAMLAIMNGFIAVAEGSVKKGIQRKQDKAAQHATGKYPIMGADDGRMYDANYAGRPKTGIYSGPQIGLFNEDPSRPELVVDGRTTRQLMINYPAVYRGIRQLASGGAPQFAEGKYPEQMNIISGSPRDPELTSAINNMSRVIALLMKNGVQFPIVPFKKDLDELSDLINQTGMGGFKK